VELVPDALVVVDEKGRIAHANEIAELLFGFEPGELKGRSVESLVPDELATLHVLHRREYFAAPHTRPPGNGIELRARRRDGSEFPAEITSPRSTPRR